MMLALRIIHILTGVFWGGTAWFTASFLLPAVTAAGPAAGPVMRQLVAVRRFPVFVASSAGLTVLSGLGMYWHNNRISAGSFAKSTAGMTYGVGAVFAIVTLLIGMTLITPAAKKLTQLGATIAASGGPPSPEQATTVAALQNKMKIGSRVVAAFLLVTIVSMAIARYL
jgi:ribose/xylose/arabinose/galactoside ABC-type transport system permease subunit